MHFMAFCYQGTHTLQSLWYKVCSYFNSKYLFRRRSKKTSHLHVTGFCEGNSSVTGEFPAQGASNAERFLSIDDVVMILSHSGLLQVLSLTQGLSNICINIYLYICMYICTARIKMHASLHVAAKVHCCMNWAVVLTFSFGGLYLKNFLFPHEIIFKSDMFSDIVTIGVVYYI